MKTSDIIKALEDGKSVRANNSVYTDLYEVMRLWSSTLVNDPDYFTIIEPKKTVKYEAWENNFRELRFYSRTPYNSEDGWRRVEAADKEYEV